MWSERAVWGWTKPVLEDKKLGGLVILFFFWKDFFYVNPDLCGIWDGGFLVTWQAVYEQRVKEVAMAVPLLCCAFDLYNVPSKRQVIVAGTRNSPDAEALVTSCHANFDPDKTVSARARAPFDQGFHVS